MATIVVEGQRINVPDEMRTWDRAQQDAFVSQVVSDPRFQERLRQRASEAAPKPDVRAEGAAASPIPGDAAMSGGGIEAALIGARQGVTFGFGDEINAGVRAAADWAGGKLGLSEPTTIGDAYDQRLAHERALLDQTRKENPVSATAGEIAGSALPALASGGASAGGTLAAQAGRGALAGAATGAAYGFGEGEGGVGNRLAGAAIGGATGAAVGGAAPYLVRGAERALTSRAASRAVDDAAKAAPSIDELRSASSAIYDRIGQRGVAIKESAFTPLVNDIATATKEMGIDPDLTPRSVAALRRLTEVKGQDISWRDLETLRRVTSIASTAKDPADRRVAGAIVGKVDDFVLNLVDGDLTSGTAVGLSDDLKEARQLWKQMRGSERLAGSIEAAKNAASGVENGLRVEFRKLIGDKKFFRTLSSTEQDAVKQVVRGTTAGNILKRVSRLSFGTGAQTNFLGASVGSGAGAAVGGAVGGPIGAAVGAALPPLVGRAAGSAAERATLDAALRAQGLVAAGPNALAAIEPPNMAPLANALAAARTPAAGLTAGYLNPSSPAR